MPIVGVMLGPGSHTGELRPLTILAEGPFTLGPDGPMTTMLRVPVERIGVGPRSARFDVVVRGPEGKPLDLLLGEDADPWMLMDECPPRDLGELLANRRFLAQHTYAVAASTLAAFESTLGRRMGWPRGRRLKIHAYDTVPYADSGYDREEGVIRFGHRRDGRERLSVPLALYRDLVAHEVTHAILAGYRTRWSDQFASLDQFALHEAIADLVAMLSVFSSADRVEQLLDPLGSGATDLAGLDEQILLSGLFSFGDGLFSHGPARQSMRTPVSGDWRTLPDPHRRGEPIVRVILNVVARLWKVRLDQPGGRSSLYQVAKSGAKVGEQVLAMLIRGLGYMAPVDVTWTDLLRGILSADLVLVPQDRYRYRQVVRDAFAEVGVTTDPDEQLSGTGAMSSLRYPVRLSALGTDPEEIVRFIWENGDLLRETAMDERHSITVDRVRPSIRVSPDGFVVSEIGASFVQEFTIGRTEMRRLGLTGPGPVTVRGGGLLRFDEGGHLCYAALKPVYDARRQQNIREAKSRDAAMLAEITAAAGSRVGGAAEKLTFHRQGRGR
ncbi:gluzincin family metallopeptidase [Arthrobacter sp. HLT1-21]